ncbi:RidA family protein [Paenibacillus glacialis]|uniref:Enamine deaminase RidA n=1 Tax=Paenibacillus glacialis TaxID=494026 RepID=A0A162PW59_9BACL|nr:RidA family protein [Paenibacillus glacialis]OAB39780.1 enamine deaminase RidA [Paenibacillus glacialis]
MITRVTTPFSYSSAVVAGDYVFLGLHRGFGEKFTEQIHDTFFHLKNTLLEVDVPIHNIVKVNVYLKDIKDLPEMERFFCEYFDTDKFPARMTSTTDFIDSDCLMMIDGIAYKRLNSLNMI